MKVWAVPAGSTNCANMLPRFPKMPTNSENSRPPHTRTHTQQNVQLDRAYCKMQIRRRHPTAPTGLSNQDQHEANALNLQWIAHTGGCGHGGSADRVSLRGRHETDVLEFTMHWFAYRIRRCGDAREIRRRRHHREGCQIGTRIVTVPLHSAISRDRRHWSQQESKDKSSRHRTHRAVLQDAVTPASSRPTNLRQACCRATCSVTKPPRPRAFKAVEQSNKELMRNCTTSRNCNLTTT